MTFASKYTLKEHIPLHSDERPFPCTKCENKYATNKALKLHLSRSHEKRYQCKFCMKRFGRSSELKQHKQQREKKGHCEKEMTRSVMINQHPGQVSECNQCGATQFVKKWHPTCKPENVQAYRCNICNSVFSDFVSLNNHITEHCTLVEVWIG